METKKINHLKIFSEEETKKVRELKIKHAKRAFNRRFQYELSDSEYAEIMALTQSENAEVVMWQKYHGSVIKMHWNGFGFFAVYGHKIECIVTFFPLDMTPKLYEEGNEDE